MLLSSLGQGAQVASYIKLINRAAKIIATRKNIYGTDRYWKMHVKDVREALEAVLGDDYVIIPVAKFTTRSKRRGI